MANVTGESATTVSDQMTAIWNNFDDGSKKLSYYADVLTALGAATASSSDEISEGINKFAATAKTVGLSYEYATAALATVTARTRESADVVGNAFKTLFARIQGLNQGDTLDDGTTLNKYSSALDKVGVNIKATSGELKDMDTIIDELGPKWKTLADDQKMALAQTVAGVRQYSQFMALMNNYDYFKENVGVAEGAEGTLQEQADIYAESWEAASKRVRAAAESLYQDLIDDKFFISINNGIANVLSGLDAFIDKAGGLKTVITAVSGVFLSAFASKIPDALKTAKYNLEVLTGGSQKAYQNIFKQMQESTNKAFKENDINPSSSLGMELKLTNALTMAKNKYLRVQDQLSESEKQSVQTRLAILEASKQEIVLEQQKNEVARKSIEEKKTSFSEKEFYNWNAKSVAQSQKITSSFDLSEVNNFKDTGKKNQVLKSYEDFAQSLSNYQKTIPVRMRELNRSILNSMSKDGTFEKAINPFKVDSKNGKDSLSLAFANLQKTARNTSQSISNNFAKELEALQKSLDPTTLKLTGLDNKFKELIETAKKGVDNGQAEKMVEDLENSLNNATIPAEKLKELLSNWHGEGNISAFISEIQKISDSETNLIDKNEILLKQTKEFDVDHIVGFSEAFASLASGVMNAYTAFQSIKSIFSSIDDTSLSLGETLTSVFSGITSLLFVLPRLGDSVKTVAAGIKAFGVAVNSAKIAGLSSIVTMGIAVGLIIGIAGAIALVVAGIKKVKENSLEGQIKKSAEAAKELSEQVDKAKSSYEDLLNTIDSYKNASDNLDDLKAGTIEFTQALLEANEQAWKLINTLGLTKNSYKIENGRIVIDFDSGEFDNKVKDYQDKQEEVYAAQIGVQQQNNQLNYEKQVKDTFTNTDLDIYNSLLTDDFLQAAFKGTGLTGELNDITFENIQAEAEQAVDGYEKIFADKLAQQMGYLEKGKSMYTSYLDTGAVNGEYVQVERQISSLITVLRENGDGFKGLYSTYLQTQTSNQNSQLQSLMYSLSNEEAYQNSEYGGQIATAVAEARTEALTNEYKDSYSKKTDEEINKEFEDWAKNQGKYVENGKIYEDSSKETELYANFNRVNKENALVGTKVTNRQETEVLDKINELDNAMTKVPLGLKDYAEALASGGNITKLTQEQIEYIKSHGGIESIIGSGLDDVAAIFGDNWQDFIDKINNAVETYKPGDEFDLNSWKTQYNNLQEIISKVASGGTIDATAYNQLDEQYQQYFSEQIDGSYKLIGLASDFKEIVESTEINNLKESQKNSVSSLFDINEQLGTNINYSQIEKYANEDNNSANINLIKAMGMEVPEEFQAQVETTREAAQAYIDLTNKIAENSSVIAMAITNYKDLDKALKDQSITVEDYNKKLKELNATLDEDIDETTYEHLTEAIQGLAEDSDLDNIGADEFSQDLKDDAKAAGDAAESILRYDKAVERVKKNQTDWQKILKSGNLQDVAEITDDLANSYEDLLNLSKGALSDSFVTDAKNLDLLTQAANGSLEAYDELASRANEEIIAECKLNTNFNQEQFDTALANFQSLVSGIDLPNLEVGTKLDGVDGFLAACEQLVNAAGMTATQAQNYLMSLGIDAEVTEDTQDVEEQVATEVYSTGVKRGVVRLPYSLFGTSGYNMIQTYDGQSYDSRPVMATRKVKGVGLKVSNAHTAAGGNVKFNNSSNGGGSKSSSSGGRGGSKSITYADSKSFSDQDRYHTIKNQLEDLNAQYDALDEAKDRAFGKSKLKEMDAEIAKTDELIDKQKEYLREIEDYLPKDKAIMEKAYNEYIGGPGIEYDALGNISNFDAIQDAMFNKYNSMASAYTDDSDEWKAFEKKYELLEKYIEQYEETYDLLRDERDKMQELINQKIDLGLEKVQYQVEVSLDVPDDAIKVLEYRIGRVDDDVDKSLEAVSLLTQKAEQVYDKIQINKQALNDVLKLSMSVSEINEVLAGNTAILAGKTFTEDQIEAVKDYRDALIDLNEEFDDIRDSVEEKVMDVFDEWRDKLSTGVETIEHYGNTLESFRNIIDIVGKETLGITGDLMNKLAQSTVDVAIDKLKGTKRTYEAIMASRDDAEKNLQAAQARNDEASVKMWQETLDTINEEVRSANEEMMQAWEDALSSIADNFENTVNDLIDTFQKSVYALGGLDGLSDDFSRQQENADLMLDDYQKIYELSKLSRDINKTIDDTDIISGKQKLKKLLGQINDLQADGNEMSKYDLEYLQKTYDLRLAEIELEEAQRAKNTVRLQKDSEGNWSYIYTQSSDAIDSAQQKYEDALYAMQDLSSNYIDEMSEKLISTSKDMEEALAAIRIQDYASIDDYYAEVKRVQDQYQEELDNQQNELQKAISNNKELYDTDWTNYHNATGYKISDTQDFATAFKDTLLGSLMDSESDTANFTDIIGDSVYNLTLGLMQAAETYYQNIENAMNAAGTSTGDFAEDASESIDKVVDKSKEGTEAINDMAEQMTTALDNITNSVNQWQENYGMAMEKIIQSNLDVVESFNNMLAAMSIDPDSITIKYDIANSAKDQKLSSFDTGGYTGDWDSNGKLAVLHQKELVLNEDDTANMLAAVQFTRSILDTIDLNAKMASLGLGTLSAVGLKDSNEQTLQQDVQINATFPNVVNHTEIEEALSNLINHASQYANRK